LESNKTNGHKQDSQDRLRSTMTEGGQTYCFWVFFIKITLFPNNYRKFISYWNDTVMLVRWNKYIILGDWIGPSFFYNVNCCYYHHMAGNSADELLVHKGSISSCSHCFGTDMVYRNTTQKTKKKMSNTDLPKKPSVNPVWAALGFACNPYAQLLI
jgi:hypothetical protein